MYVTVKGKYRNFLTFEQYFTSSFFIMNKISIQFDLQELLCEAMQKKAESDLGHPLDSHEIAQIRAVVEEHIIDDDIDYQWDIQYEAQKIHKDKVHEIINNSLHCCLAVIEAKYSDLISMPRLIKNFIEAHADLLEIKDDPIYQEELKYLYKYYHNCTLDLKTGRFAHEYLKSPQSYNPQEIGIKIFADIIKTYIGYWEDTISCMIKKNAIRDRRKYLAVQLDEAITNMSDDYPNLLVNLKKYQEFNANEIEKIKQLMISKN